MAAECKEAKKVMMQGIRNGILLYFCDFFFEKSDEKKDRYIYIGIGKMRHQDIVVLKKGYLYGKRRNTAYVSLLSAGFFL